MARRLLRRLKRNPGRVLSLVVRDVLLTGKNVVGLVAAGVGLAGLAAAVGALLAGGLVSAAVFGAVGATAVYGAGQSFFGRPLRGAGLVLAGLLIIGGGAHALGVGPADQSTDEPTVETGDTITSIECDESGHSGQVDDGLNVYEDEGSESDVGLSTRSDDELGP